MDSTPMSNELNHVTVHTTEREGERLKMTDKESKRQGQRDKESRIKEKCADCRKNKDPTKNVN